MQLSPDQLARQLERGLAPCYLLSGEEVLLVNECADQIRAAARTAGYSEHMRWTVEAGFNWNDLNTSTQSLSLFAERRLIELRLPTGKPGEAGAEFIAGFAGNPPPDTLLLVLTGKLDKAARESVWARALETAGAHVQARPFEARQLPGWITQRLQSRGLQPAPGVVDILAWHLEGNLLAAAQEVDKLAMRVGSGAVTRADVEQCLADNSRFTIYQWVDAALSGNAAGARRMLTSLRADGTEPILLLWALARELRSLAPLAAKRARGQNEAAVLASVWQSRRALVGSALKRHPALAWTGFLRRAARIDRILKGRARGELWLELERLILSIAGARNLPGDAELLEKYA